MKTNTASLCLWRAVLVVGLLAAPASAESLDTEIIFTASDASIDDRLGQAVAISGNVAIAGADRNSHAGIHSGAAYLFDVTTGNELFKLTASDADERDVFGHSVAISGNTAIVGAQNNDDVVNLSGSAYLFDVTTGTELFKLTASDAAEGDQFGHGLGVSGNRAIVGSFRDDDMGKDSGSAYLFDVATGEELFKITASDGAAGDWFGYWAAISGNLAIVGARRDDGVGINSGSAYVYDVTTGEELMKLTASDETAGAEFGYAVAIDGTTAIIGTWGDNFTQAQPGAAYLFDLTTGNELAKLTASDGVFGDEYGYSVDIDGDTAIVGAYGDAGAAYVYDVTRGYELFKVTASDTAAGNEFGTAVGISGNIGVVGAWLDDTSVPNTGQAYLYDFSAELPQGADFNDDGVVDNADLLLWEKAYAGPQFDANDDGQVMGVDFLFWQRSFGADGTVLDDSPANLDQQGPVDGSDAVIWEQAYGVDDFGDVDNDGDTDGLDYLEWLRAFTPYDAADENYDRLVDGGDLLLWCASYGYTGVLQADGDGDGDSDSDGLDLLVWQQQFTGSPPLASAVQVPEQGSWLLVLEFLVTWIGGCRYRFGRN
ncbi:MAG: FG-GAP repeat protein [Pirellulales bacterium]|nr:FG-GAP repeat protein [Pirellulales bacterium]